MTVVSTVPDSTMSNSFTVVNAATVHEALADRQRRDSTFIQGSSGAAAMVGCSEPSIPSGAVVKQIALFLRASGVPYSGWPPQLYVGLRASEDTTKQEIVSLNSSAQATAYFAAGTLVTDRATMVELSFAVVASGADTASVISAYVQTTYVAKPTVSVTAPVTRGTVRDTNLPLVSWMPTLDSDGGPQQYFAVRIYRRSQYEAGGWRITDTPLLGSGDPASFHIVRSSDTNWQPTSTLPDDTYRAYVASGQIVNGVPHFSDWAYSEFTVSVVLPPSPTLTVTPEASLARHRVEIAASGSSPSTDMLEVQYSHDGGVSWAPIRTDLGETGLVPPVGGAATVWDFEAPNGREATYRVRSLHNYSGVYAASAWVEASATWASAQEWLVHPLDPSRTIRVTIGEVAARQRQARRGVFQPLGSLHVVTVSDTRSTESGSVVLQVERADHAALDALVESGVPLLLLGAAGSAWPFPRYLAIGDTDRIEGNAKGFCTWTLDTLQWTQVDRPRGGLLTVPA